MPDSSLGSGKPPSNEEGQTEVVARNRDGHPEVVLKGPAGILKVANGTKLAVVRDLGDGSIDVQYRGQTFNVRKHNTAPCAPAPCAPDRPVAPAGHHAEGSTDIWKLKSQLEETQKQRAAEAGRAIANQAEFEAELRTKQRQLEDEKTQRSQADTSARSEAAEAHRVSAINAELQAKIRMLTAQLEEEQELHRDAQAEHEAAERELSDRLREERQRAQRSKDATHQTPGAARCSAPGCGKPSWNGQSNDYCSRACEIAARRSGHRPVTDTEAAGDFVPVPDLLPTR